MKKKKKERERIACSLLRKNFQGSKQISVSGSIYWGIDDWKKAKLPLGGTGEVSKKSLKNVGGWNLSNTIRHTHQLGCDRPGIFLPKTVVALHKDVYFGSSFSILRWKSLF